MKVDDINNINKTLVKESELEEEASSVKQPKRTKLQTIVLVLGCLLMFGNNYAFDNPQALQRQMTEDLDITTSQYNLLYTAFSFPNIFLTLIGGLIIDFLGVRFGILLFSALIVVAQTIVALGGTLKIFWIMLCGRVLFGSASENLVIAQAAIIGKWFRGKELSTAIGYIMTIPEIASAANSFVTPLIYDQYEGLTYPLFFSVILCVFSFVCAVILCILDKKEEANKLKGQFIIEEAEDDEEPEKQEEIEKVSFKDIKNLNGTFWILVLICTLTLGSYVPFLDDANDFLQEKFEFSSVQAGKVLTLPYIMAAITSPFLGPYIDKVGKRRKFILITCSLFCATHFVFGIMSGGHDEHPNWYSVIPLIFLGSSYALYSCVLIPSIQYVVEERVVGTAFGLLGMFESISLAFFPILAGYIVDIADEPVEGYSRVSYFFSGVSMLGMLFTLSLYFFDKKSSMILDFVNPEDPTELEQRMLKSTRSEESSEESSSSEEDSDSDDPYKKKKAYKSYSSLKSKKLQSPNIMVRSKSLYR